MSLKRKAPSSDGNLNSDITNALIELAEWEKNTNRNQHKSNAYKKAAGVISKLDYRLASGKEAKKLPGIGEKISLKIDEIVSTGKLAKLENIHQDEASIAINLLTRVSGIGPAKARDLYDEGIRDLDQLRKHAFRNELDSSARFKLNHHQMIGLKHFEDFERRIPRDEVTEILAKLEKCVGEFDKEYKLTVCGSYRREAESSGDMDVLLTHSGYRTSDKKHGNLLHRLVSELEKAGLLTDKLSEGDTKFMGACRLDEDAPFRRIDIRLLPLNQYFCGILYFTGSDVFNKAMRAHALTKGFTLNEYSLRPTKDGEPQEPLPVSSERDVFDYLDYPYKEPKDRT